MGDKKNIWSIKNLHTYTYRFSSGISAGRKLRGNLLIQVHLEKRLLRWRQAGNENEHCC